MQRARYSQHPSRAQQQQATPCTCGRYALSVVELLSNLRSVTHHIYLSPGAMQQLHAACICTHVASYQPGAVEVQTVVLLLLYGLKSSRLRSLPGNSAVLAGSQEKAAVRTHITPACRPPDASCALLFPLLSYYLHFTAVRVVPEESWWHFSVSEYKTRRIRYVVTTRYLVLFSMSAYAA